MIRHYELLGRMTIVTIVTIVAFWVLSGCGRNPVLTQTEAEEMAGVFCLPTYLPTEVDPTPVFYAAGEPEIPDATALYKNIETSERVFVITMQNVTYTSDIMLRNDPCFYDPYEYCKNRFVLPNGFRVCDTSALPREPNFERDILIKGPSFVTFLSWLVHQDDKWTVYYISSSLSLEETKKIAASMCINQ